MAAKRIPVKLYYDVISPYSYFAFETIMRYRSIWSKMDLQLKPVHLFAILKATENTPPLLNQIKSKLNLFFVSFQH